LPVLGHTSPVPQIDRARTRDLTYQATSSGTMIVQLQASSDKDLALPGAHGPQIFSTAPGCGAQGVRRASGGPSGCSGRCSTGARLPTPRGRDSRFGIGHWRLTDHQQAAVWPGTGSPGHYEKTPVMRSSGKT